MATATIGIDLGTTRACAAVADAGGDVRLVPCGGGAFAIPSVLAVDEHGRELVGAEAARLWLAAPTRAVHGVKRLLGRGPDAAIVARTRRRVAYAIVAGPDGHLAVEVGGRRLAVVEVAARILASLRDAASQHLGGDVRRAVLTVPACFDARQRQDVRDAGALAGLEVVQLLDEPSAVALAYGAGRHTGKTVVVVDLGGGVLDVAAIDIRGQRFATLSARGDAALGGVDFDDALVQYVAADFRAAHGVELEVDATGAARLRDGVRRLKAELSLRATARLRIPAITHTASGAGVDLDVQLRRDELEVVVEPLVERAVHACRLVLSDAGLAPAAIDELLLVGAQSRTPLLRARVQGLFGRSPCTAVAADEAAVVGAALWARGLAEGGGGPRVVGVVSSPIGVETADGGVFPLFARNTATPARRLLTFATEERDQRELVVRVRQGDAGRATDLELVEELCFGELPRGAAGAVALEVELGVDAEGLVTAAARERQSGAVVPMQKRRGAPPHA